jgi:hypothetical protein
LGAGPAGMKRFVYCVYDCAHIYRHKQRTMAFSRKTVLLVGVVVILAGLALWGMYTWGSTRTANAIARRSTHDALTGLWVAPPGFCKSAGLRNMKLIVLEPDAGRKDGSVPASDVRAGYLTAVRSDGAVVSNQRLELDARWPAHADKTGKGAFVGRMSVTHRDNDVWPHEVKIAYHPGNRRLQVYDDEKTWGLFHRDDVAGSILKTSAELEEV